MIYDGKIVDSSENSSPLIFDGNNIMKRFRTIRAMKIEMRYDCETVSLSAATFLSSFVQSVLSCPKKNFFVNQSSASLSDKKHLSNNISSLLNKYPSVCVSLLIVYNL